MNLHEYIREYSIGDFVIPGISAISENWDWDFALILKSDLESGFINRKSGIRDPGNSDCPSLTLSVSGPID